MQLFALGLNHHTAPLAIRERVAFQPSGWIRPCTIWLRIRCARRRSCRPAIAPSSTLRPNSRSTPPTGWRASISLALTEVSPYLYSYPQRDAIRHVFRVASGLDSMVIGEPQILGQVKDAVRHAEEAGTMGVLLHKLFQNTFAVAKEVRSTTAIGANTVSMAAAAVHLAERIFERVSDQHVLFIGAGEMIELCAAHFGGARPKSMTVANRTEERAQALAARFGAQHHAHRPDRRCAAALRRGGLLYGRAAADRRPGHGRARGQGAPPPPDGDGRSRRAARHRARDRRARRHLPVHGRRPRPGGRGWHGIAPAGGVEAEQIIDHPGRWLPALDVGARVGAGDPLAARARRIPAPGRTRTRGAPARQGRRPAARARGAVARPHQQADARPHRFLNQAEGEHKAEAGRVVRELFNLSRDHH
jgi:glutamyl-tRNA reductase (EC 1.2.1.70)